MTCVVGGWPKQHNALPKGLGELLGADGFVAVLQFIENPLQRQGNTLAGVISLCRHHVHRLGGQQWPSTNRPRVFRARGALEVFSRETLKLHLHLRPSVRTQAPPIHVMGD